MGKGIEKYFNEWIASFGSDLIEVGKHGWLIPSAEVHSTTDFKTPSSFVPGFLPQDVSVDIDVSDITFLKARDDALFAKERHGDNEELLTTGIVRIIHKHYGGYDKTLAEIFDGIGGARAEIGTLSAKGNDITEAEMKEVRSLAAKMIDLEAKKGEYHDARGGKDLSDYAKGSLVCREQALLASYLLHEVGIENHLVSGYVTSGRFSVTAEAHAYVVIDKSGAVVEATINNPLSSYKRPCASDNVSKAGKACNVCEPALSSIKKHL